jgi:hypothetical protein
VLCLPVQAEELLPSVQRELRARRFYFGEINGRATDETIAAIEKFQLAKGIDKTGQLDRETLRTLGLPGDVATDAAEARTLEECCACVVGYLKAWQKGVWDEEASFFTEVVNYYDDQNVRGDFIREVRAREIRRWPHRTATMLNRIASLEPGQPTQAQVTARVRMEVAAEAGKSEARTEDLLFRLEKTERGWRIAALKLLE